MKLDKVVLILKFAMASASRLDDYRSQELAPIALLKLVYLADLACAEIKGETFTHTPWLFHHFGPWNSAVHQLIDPTLQQMSTKTRTFQDSQGNQGTRYSLELSSREKSELYLELERQLPISVVGMINQTLKNYANDTPGLLSYVYKTKPMKSARPHSELRFDALPQTVQAEPAPPKKISTKEKRRRKEMRLRMRARYQEKEAELSARAEQLVEDGAVYDELFFEGLAWLDELAGADPPETQGILEFGAIWDTEMRMLDEIP